MRTRILARFALAFALALVPVATTSGQIDAVPRPADSDPDAASGFPWLCFVISVAALVGLYVVVRRRERATEAEYKAGRRPDDVWYCRACDRDVSGPICPHCRAPNPFIPEPIEHPPRNHAKRDRPEKSEHSDKEPQRRQ
jgi:hypothetical protein